MPDKKIRDNVAATTATVAATGKRTIPAFLQRLDGDDIADFAGRIEQIDAVQLFLRASGDGDLVLGDAFPWLGSYLPSLKMAFIGFFLVILQLGCAGRRRHNAVLRTAHPCKPSRRTIQQ